METKDRITLFLNEVPISPAPMLLRRFHPERPDPAPDFGEDWVRPPFCC
jgi:hypothetical protein